MIQRQGCLSTAPRKYAHRLVLGRGQQPVTSVLNSTMCGFADMVLAEPLSAGLHDRAKADRKQKYLTGDLQIGRFDRFFCYFRVKKLKVLRLAPPHPL